MDVVHANWRWVKLLASLNKVSLCTYALVKLYDHVILNSIIGKFLSGIPLSRKEILLLKEVVDVGSKAMTRARILSTSPIDSVDDVLTIMNKLNHEEYLANYIWYVRRYEPSFIYEYCLRSILERS